MKNPSACAKLLLCCFFSVGLVNAAWAVDSTAPVLFQITPVKLRTNDTTPSYTFSTTEGGSIIYWGSCVSATRTAYIGSNTVTFSALLAGIYSNCGLSVQDGYGNMSTTLGISAFTIDLTAPVLAQVTAIPAMALLQS